MHVVKGVISWIKLNSFYIAFFLITLSVIYVLFPKQGTNKLEFQKGNPWRHKNLIAPFDFPILKTSDVINAELDSIKRDFIPYIVIDNQIESKQISLFEKEFDELYSSGSIKLNIQQFDTLQKTLKSILQNCYKRGIVETNDKSLLMQFGKDNVYFINNNIAEIKQLKDVLTLKGAYVLLTEQLSGYETIEDDLKKVQDALNIAKFLEPNLKFDQKINDKMLNELLAAHSISRGVIQSGERIISEGDIVNNQNYILLESLQQAYKKNSLYGGWVSNMIIGKMLLVFVLMLVLIFYLEIFNRDILWKKRNFALIFASILVTFIMARLIYDNHSISFYVIPVCILPIIIRTFMGIRLSIFIHMITILLIGFMAPNGFEFVFIQLIAGVVAIISLSKIHRRGHLIITALTVISTYSIIYFGFELIKQGHLKLINWVEIKWFAISGFLILIAYPLIFIYEKIFGFTSDVTLMELSDTNHPLLRRLAEEAPGTFQHSLQVANLAEAVIMHTGGNAMLVRAGALYHDVGKIINSHFFIENQMGGDNPHKNLSNTESAAIIINHVAEGAVLAKKYKVPEMIIDFINMHHGKSLTRYFYLKERDDNLGKHIDDNQFMYPGPNPRTRETAVLMLADCVEAATRSLPVKNEENLKKTIDQLIDFKINNHELDDAPITFKDVKAIKEIFLKKLINIYHIRIQYPVTDYLRK